MPSNILAVSVGAVFGALARYAFTHVSSEMTGHGGFPFGTLAVNAIGSFVVGWVLAGDHGNEQWRLFAATGFCGAFTTFSAFAYESMEYLRQGNMMIFAVNVVANNVLCLLAVIGGAAARSVA